MVPTPLHSPHSSRLFVLLYTLTSNYVSRFFSATSSSNLDTPHDVLQYGLSGRFLKRAREEPHDTRFIIFACLIPVLVILSGIFAGLTLGYMSLDETQLNVLSISGTP
jgi:metal transporter CNNM